MLLQWENFHSFLCFIHFMTFIFFPILCLYIYTYSIFIVYREGNGNPLQCSCLENPRDRGAWWAADYGVAQSRTWLKRFSSSSSSSDRHINVLYSELSGGKVYLLWQMEGACVWALQKAGWGILPAALNSCIIWDLIFNCSEFQTPHTE